MAFDLTVTPTSTTADVASTEGFTLGGSGYVIGTYYYVTVEAPDGQIAFFDVGIDGDGNIVANIVLSNTFMNFDGAYIFTATDDLNEPATATVQITGTTPPLEPTISVTPLRTRQTQAITDGFTVTVDGFEPNSEINILLTSPTGNIIASAAVTDSSGAYSNVIKPSVDMVSTPGEFYFSAQSADGFAYTEQVAVQIEADIPEPVVGKAYASVEEVSSFNGFNLNETQKEQMKQWLEDFAFELDVIMSQENIDVDNLNAIQLRALKNASKRNAKDTFYSFGRDSGVVSYSESHEGGSVSEAYREQTKGSVLTKLTASERIAIGFAENWGSIPISQRW